MSDSDSPVDVDIPDDALCLVACGKSKIRTYDEDLERHVPVPADQLYTSSYAVVKRNLALTCEDHRILSAEHGIVAPDHLLEYYDTKMGDVPDSEFDAETPGTLAWKIEQSLTRWSEQYDDPTIILLGGTDYIDPLEDVYSRVPATVRFPLQEAELPGMMAQMSWMSDRAEERQA